MNWKRIRHFPFLTFFYLPSGIILVYMMYTWVTPKADSYLPGAYGGAAIAISFIAAPFICLPWLSLRIRTIAVTLLGIIAAVLTIGDGHPGTYASLGAGIALVAGSIALFRGLAKKPPFGSSPSEVRTWAFHVMTIITIAVAGFLVALLLSALDYWKVLIDILALDPSLVSYENILKSSAEMGDWIPANTVALLAFALYYFIGIGLMVLEVMQLNSSNK